MKPMLSEFILYLTEQLQEPYLWGGQHTRLTPENYVAVIKRKEALVSNQEKAIAYCEKMFAKGYTVLYAYDCSGLGMYWLYNLKKLYGSDLNANSLMGHCELVEGPPKRGYWVFKLNGNRASLARSSRQRTGSAGASLTCSGPRLWSLRLLRLLSRNGSWRSWASP